MEQCLPKPICQTWTDHQKECSYSILQWEITTILRNRCICCCSRSKSSASEGWHGVHKEWDTWQCSPVANNIHEQEPNNSESLYSNIEREALGILYGLEKFHHYCFAHEISIIRDHKLLVAIFKKDEASFSHIVQRILLCIH